MRFKIQEIIKFLVSEIEASKVYEILKTEYNEHITYDEVVNDILDELDSVEVIFHD